MHRVHIKELRLLWAAVQLPNIVYSIRERCLVDAAAARALMLGNVILSVPVYTRDYLLGEGSSPVAPVGEDEAGEGGSPMNVEPDISNLFDPEGTNPENFPDHDTVMAEATAAVMEAIWPEDHQTVDAAPPPRTR